MSRYIGAISNTTAPLQVWRFENIWNAQSHPFIDSDIAYNNESFDVFNISVGFDLVLYLGALFYLVVRSSFCVNPEHFDSEDILGSFAISITRSLFYIGI